jgi:hypothetical protein
MPHPIANSIEIVGFVVFFIAFCWPLPANVDFLLKFAPGHKARKADPALKAHQ